MNIQPPHSIETEQILIDCLLSDKEAQKELFPAIEHNFFYIELNQRVFRAAKELYNNNLDVDVLSLKQKLPDIEMFQLVDLIKGRSYMGDLGRFVSNLIEMYARRELIKISHAIQHYMFDLTKDVFIEIEKVIKSINQIMSLTVSADIVHISESVKQSLKKIQEMEKGVEKNDRFTTGYKCIDESTKGGTFVGDFTIIAGETSQGKTSFALNKLFNMHLSQYGYKSKKIKTLFISLEQSKEKITNRLISICTCIANWKLSNNELEKSDWDIIDKTINELIDSEIYLVGDSMTEFEIINMIKEYNRKYGINHVVIDYLQLVKAGQKYFNPEQKAANIARLFQSLCVSENISIEALSQMRRDLNNPEPNLNRLRDSGQIEEAADNVIFIYRPDKYGRNFKVTENNDFSMVDTKNKAQIIIDKGRNIGTHDFILNWNSELTMFTEINDVDNWLIQNDDISSLPEPF